jgi:hypothetical protein
VLITVGATVIALFPLASHGGPLWEPMCYAQIGGLSVATFITLLLVPVIYSIFVLDLKLVKWEKTEETPRTSSCHCVVSEGRRGGGAALTSLAAPFLMSFVLRVFWGFLWLLRFSSVAGPFVLSDRLSFLEQRVPERPKHLQQQIEFPQALTSRAHRPEKELELNTPTTVSNGQHVVAPLVFTTATRLNFRQNVRSGPTRN